MATPRIGFIGLGRMGGPMSLRLINAGFDLVVFDTNPEASAPQKNAGAGVASSSKEVFDLVDLAFVSLPTPDIVEKVVLGGVEQGSRVKTIVDLSTSGPGMAGRVSKALEEHGIAWVDAPVSGGIAGAKGGTLAVMASGPRPLTSAQSRCSRISASCSTWARRPASRRSPSSPTTCLRPRRWSSPPRPS